MRLVTSLGSGLLFALGLGLSGMTDPHKVRAFLDVTGAWDPSLMLVMGGAAAVGLLLTTWTLRRSAPVLDAQFHLPPRAGVDAPLVAGAALFGVGWGLSGYCPGPALVSLVTLDGSAWWFGGAMLAGMAAFQTVERFRARAAERAGHAAAGSAVAAQTDAAGA